MGFVKNEKGQMAIFIALFFQVIFVFFAMAINVGLTIHDKINLQNAVDLAAYYGAMKQGEVLNQMAHINYQMRQNYKLFVWRYRVLGTMGNRNHPLMYIPYYGGRNTLAAYPDAESWNPGNPITVNPTVCVSHSIFQETKDLDNNAASVCRENSLAIPAVPQVSSPIGFVPGASQLPNIFGFLANQIARFCLEAGVINFAFSARILAHYRIDGLVKKNMMNRLATNLSGPSPLDLRNEPIEDGVRSTLRLNLTDTNLSSFDNDGEFNYYNSLSDESCNDPSEWVVDIKINPVIFYSDWNSNQTTGECPPAKPVPNRQGSSNPNPVMNGLDNLPAAFQYGQFNGWNQGTQELQGFWQGEPNDEGHSSVGFEKNPWCMVYSGVRAVTTVRKPFDPTSSGIRLEARGFAKPFGGRFGPWYGRTWPRGNPNSQAGSRAQMVDPLLPSRDVPGGSGAADPNDDVANYSRYPGDPFGMSSLRAMAAMMETFMPALNHPNKDAPSPMAIASYDHLGSRARLENTGDSLARQGQTRNRLMEPVQRNFEIAAVAPDVFDATYYSVEPRYYNNYFTSQTTGGGAQFASNNLQEAVFDYGSSKDGATINGVQTQRPFAIWEQVEMANGIYSQAYENHIKNWQHLLTSWHQQGVVTYGMDPSKFGQCAVSVDDHNPNLPSPGNCLQGGRTGYSVKNVSRDYLMSNDHALGGGAGGTSGAILNQPPF